jgi:hypothetical protein
MAVLVTEQLDDVISTTIRHIVPMVVDNFFTSRALFVRMMARNNVVLDGGHEIQQPFLYDSPPGGSYSLGEELDITRKQVMSSLRFPWATYFGAVTVEGQEMLENHGPERIIDLVEIRMQAARMKLEETMGTDLYGSDVDGPGIVGLRAGCDNGDTVGSYGGITRASTGPGNVIKGNVNTSNVGLDQMTTAMGSATVGTARPDLIVMAQTTWNTVHDLLGGGGTAANNLKRFDGDASLGDAGFQVLAYQGADIVVDQQCPADHVFYLNTAYLKMYIHSQRNFETDGPWTPPNHDQKVWRIFTASAFVNCAPRLSTMMTNADA